jgi:hypothetical protein
MVLNRLVYGVSLTALVALCGAAHANTNVISNGDFELGALTGWTTYTVANGKLNPSTSDPISFVSFDADNDGTNSTAARFRVGQVGTYQAGLWAGGGLSQSFAAGTGAFSLDLDVATTQASIGTNISDSRFQIFVDGALVQSYVLAALPSGAVNRQHVSYAGIFSEGVHDLKIELTRQYYSGWSNAATSTPFQYVDDIVLSAAVSSVPEPATTLTLSAGLALIGLMIRKRG